MPHEQRENLVRIHERAIAVNRADAVAIAVSGQSRVEFPFNNGLAQCADVRLNRFGMDAAETQIALSVNVDGAGRATLATGIAFLDHMLDQVARHGMLDLDIRAKGDLHVDAHHTVEDVGIALGEVVATALGDKAGIRRFGSVSVPLDEALVDVAVDLSGRPYLAYGIEFAPDTAGLGSPQFDPQLAEEFWRAFVTAAGITLHVRLVSGKNTHHIVEASFKAVARALRDAVRVEGADIPSTKGTL